MPQAEVQQRTCHPDLHFSTNAVHPPCNRRRLCPGMEHYLGDGANLPVLQRHITLLQAVQLHSCPAPAKDAASSALLQLAAVSSACPASGDAAAALTFVASSCCWAAAAWAFLRALFRAALLSPPDAPFPAMLLASSSSS